MMGSLCKCSLGELQETYKRFRFAALEAVKQQTLRAYQNLNEDDDDFSFIFSFIFFFILNWWAKIGFIIE